MSWARVLLVTVACLTAGTAPGARAACDMEVYSFDGLKAAVENPDVTEICIGDDIKGSLEITTPPGFEDRWLEIYSMEDFDPITWNPDPSRPDEDTLIRCSAESTVSIWLRDVILDGDGVARAVSSEGLCSVNMESVQVQEFSPPAGGAAVEVDIDPLQSLEIVRSWFDRISGTGIDLRSGLLQLTQTMFTASNGDPGPGGLRLQGDSIARLRGNLFYGCSSSTGGGAVTASDGAWLVSVGDGFVGNRAPVGGAILASGGEVAVSHAVFAGNAACDGDCAPASTVGQGVTPPLEENCNFSLVDWGELPPVGLGGAEGGEGGAVALQLDGDAARFTKTLFLANEAGQGAGGALAVLGTAAGDGGDPGPVTLVHCTLSGNRAELGPAIWGSDDSAGRLTSVGGLWLDHGDTPIALADAPWEVLAAANHTDAVLLVDVPDSGALVSMEETSGATPDLAECPAGCGDDATLALCGAADADLDLALPERPVSLHFGTPLCPTDGDPWARGTGLDAPAFQMPDGSIPDRGLSGFPCEDREIDDGDGDGTPAFADCDDADPAVHPFATEICNGVDDDCDGEVDEGYALLVYPDQDGDGFGAEPPVEVCEPGEDTVRVGGDCDDTDGSVFPGAREIWDDGIDNDCNGEIDTDAQGCHSAGCFALRVSPSDDGLEISARPGGGPWLALAGMWCVFRRVRRP